MYHTNVRTTCIDTTRLRNILGVAGCARMMYLSSEKGTFLVTKSMPMVGLVSSANDSPWQRAKMLDFPTPELIGRDDVILMPHIGASTEEAQVKVSTDIATAFNAYFEIGKITKSLHFDW